MSLPSAFSFVLLIAPVAQLSERDASNVGGAGGSPAGSAILLVTGCKLKVEGCEARVTNFKPLIYQFRLIFAALAQCRGVPLRTGRLRVHCIREANSSCLGNQLARLGKPTPSRGTNFAHVVQGRDGALKTRTVPVQIRPWALIAVRKHPRVAQRRGVPLKPERLQVRVLPRGPVSRSCRFQVEGCRLGARVSVTCNLQLVPATQRSFWNVHRTSGPGLGANECVLHQREVVQVHGIPPFIKSTTSNFI